MSYTSIADLVRRWALSGAFWLFLSGLAVGQSDSLTKPARHRATYTAEVAGLASSNSRTPFWLRANQYGIIPRSSPAGLVQFSAQGWLMGRHPNRSLEYGLGVVGTGITNRTVVLAQAYVSINRGHFSLWGGRKKEIIGIGDSTLSSGLYAWSGNALPITKLQIGTRGFTPLGFTRGVVAVHAFFAHGWFADSDTLQGSYLHQKALYVRIGRPGWRVRFTGGVLHNAQWGGRSAFLSSKLAQNGQIPQSLSDYLYVLTAREGGKSDSQTLTEFDRVNRVGNHLGSIDFGLEWRLGQWQAMGYYQHPFEDKSGVVFVNFPDGLYGFRLTRPSHQSAGFQVNHLLIECLSTMSQSGSIANNSRYDGQDDYFNNYQYLDGWVQDRRVIGTPFLSYRSDLRPDQQTILPGKRIWAIANNRVQLGHVALAGTVGQGIQWQTRWSLSQNYGTYRHPLARPAAQLSGVASITWPLTWLGGSELRTAVALDQGQLLTNSLGGWLSIRKSWSTRQF